MIELTEIKDFFAERCKKFSKSERIENKLNKEEIEILFNIGLPNYAWYGGNYIILEKLDFNDNKLFFATREYWEDSYKQYLNLYDKKVYFQIEYPDNSIETHVINTDLQSYFRYLYLYERYVEDIEKPEKLGNYYEHHEKYAKELKKRLLSINNDVNKGVWSEFIEEIYLGIM